MSNYFIDSSALVKRYMPEVGTVWMRNLTAPRAGHTVFTAHITIIEVISAIARQYHDSNIDLAILQAFRQLVMWHMQTQYAVINLSNRTVTKALDLHELHRLRAYDSVQLASAIQLNQRAVNIGETITFIAADTRLLQAATVEGLATDNPNNYP